MILPESVFFVLALFFLLAHQLCIRVKVQCIIAAKSNANIKRSGVEFGCGCGTIFCSIWFGKSSPADMIFSVEGATHARPVASLSLSAIKQQANERRPVVSRQGAAIKKSLLVSSAPLMHLIEYWNWRVQDRCGGSESANKIRQRRMVQRIEYKQNEEITFHLTWRSPPINNHQHWLNWTTCKLNNK